MRPSALSNTNSTAARETGLRPSVPLKITSCIDSPRNSEAFDSPRTQRTASMTFDFPQPFGPTTPTSCPGREIVVGSTKDLKPASLSLVRRMKWHAAEKGGEDSGSQRQRMTSRGYDRAIIIAFRPSNRLNLASTSAHFP